MPYASYEMGLGRPVKVRNPYGRPGRGNFDKAWRKLMTPCHGGSKSLVVEGDRITVTCRSKS